MRLLGGSIETTHLSWNRTAWFNPADHCGPKAARIHV